MSSPLAAPCRACGHPNEAGARFCEDCGATVLTACPACGHAVGERAHFCTSCGEPLGMPRLAASSASAAPASGLSAADHRGERRPLTVLFSDLVGSTELAARLDPEDWAEIAARYQKAAAEAVLALRGHVAKYLGDGVLAYFGYPKAHDNDAERAVHAGRRIVAAVAEVNATLAAERGVRLAVRVGIHSGWVAIEGGGGSELEIFGDTPNTAARVQGAAEPDTVAISEATHRLVTGFFVVADRGPIALKGVPEPVRLFRVVAPTGVHGRVEAAGPRGLTPFVGRDVELAAIEGCWQRVRDGRGQLVLVIGEVGIGKSRLLDAARAGFAREPHIAAALQCVPYQKRTAFFPVAAMLQRGLRDAHPDAGTSSVALVRRALEIAGLDPDEVLPILAPLLGDAAPDRPAPPFLPADELRRRLLATFVAWVRGAAAVQPLVLAIEDVHWADPSSLELLATMAEQGADVPLLLLCTARPGFTAPWRARSHHQELHLARLDAPRSAAIVRGVAGAAGLAPATVDALVDRADGVPLFLEELTRAVVEHGAGASLASAEIPATIQESLLARLDRLGPAREVAQAASVVGREFRLAELRAASALGEEELRAALVRLVRSGLVRARGVPPDDRYVFEHALVQETAYASLLKSRRRELHAALARAIAAGETPETTGRPELLAHHWTEAGEHAAAVDAWERAADRAFEASAHAEAALHLEAAIGLVAALPDPTRRARRELSLQLRLGSALSWTHGYGSADVARVNARARELCGRVGDDRTRALLFLGMWSWASNRGELRAAAGFADEISAVVARESRPGGLAWAHFVQGATRFFRGEMAAARVELDRARASYREEDHLDALLDPGVALLAVSAVTAWHLGAPDAARRDVAQALALAERLGRPYGLAFARDHASMLFVALDEPDAVLAHAEPLARLSDESRLPLFAAHGVLQWGWALARLGHHAEGLAELRRGVALLAGMSQRLGLGFHLSLLSDALAWAGDLDGARSTIDAARDAVPEERHDKPEILRRRAELLARVDAGAAEAAYGEAIRAARACGSATSELRSATALARSLIAAGRREEARALLEPIDRAQRASLEPASGSDVRALLAEAG